MAISLSCGTPPSPEPVAGGEEPGFSGPGFELPDPGTYALPPIQEAADGAVLDTEGMSHRLFDYMGDRCVLLSFIYTACQDGTGCPLATAVLQMLSDELRREPGLRSEMRLLSLSFDPEHDTPEVMRRHASRARATRDAGDPPWVFLTTAGEDEVAAILDGYGQTVVREIDASGQPGDTFAHVLKVFLIDRHRRVRNIYSSSYLHPAIVINDLATLVLEEPEPHGGAATADGRLPRVGHDDADAAHGSR